MLIPVEINGQLTEMDDALLERRDVHDENENEIVNAVEYWLDGARVHRSAHVHLKKALFSVGEAAAIG